MRGTGWSQSPRGGGHSAGHTLQHYAAHCSTPPHLRTACRYHQPLPAAPGLQAERVVGIESERQRVRMKTNAETVTVITMELILLMGG